MGNAQTVLCAGEIPVDHNDFLVETEKFYHSSSRSEISSGSIDNIQHYSDVRKLSKQISIVSTDVEQNIDESEESGPSEPLRAEEEEERNRETTPVEALAEEPVVSVVEQPSARASTGRTHSSKSSSPQSKSSTSSASTPASPKSKSRPAPQVRQAALAPQVRPLKRKSSGTSASSASSASSTSSASTTPKQYNTFSTDGTEKKMGYQATVDEKEAFNSSLYVRQASTKDETVKQAPLPSADSIVTGRPVVCVTGRPVDNEASKEVTRKLPEPIVPKMDVEGLTEENREVYEKTVRMCAQMPEDWQVGMDTKDAKLVYLHEPENPIVWFHANVFIKGGDLTTAIAGIHETSEWGRWHPVAHTVNLNGKQNAMSYAATSLCSVGYFYKFCFQFHLKRFFANGCAVEAVYDVTEKDPEYDSSLKLKRTGIEAYTMIVPTQDGVVIMQRASLDMGMSVPNWVVKLVMSSMAPSVCKTFEKTSGMARQDKVYKKRIQEDKSGVYAKIKNHVANNPFKLEHWTKQGPLREAFHEYVSTASASPTTVSSRSKKSRRASWMSRSKSKSFGSK